LILAAIAPASTPRLPRRHPAQLEFLGPAGRVERRSLGEGGEILVGRDDKMDITFRDDDGGSSLHACFSITDDELRVTDASSKNGVFVNGSRVTSSRLKIGDTITLGRKGPLLKIVQGLLATKTEKP